MRKAPPVMIHEIEWPAHLGLANALGRLGYAPALHARLLHAKVDDQADARDQEDRSGFP